MKAAALILGMTVANYLYEAIHDGNWIRAFDRSWFQAAAIIIYLFIE